MSKRTLVAVSLTVGALSGWGRPCRATGLQPIDTSAQVWVQEVNYDIEVRGAYVSAVMEVAFAAGTGYENSGNLRFPLPLGAVLHRSEILLPEAETWMPAETLGRREGEEIYNNIVEPRPQVDPLLVQRIGVDFYRARVYPITQDGDMRIRIHYAHVLERMDTENILRVAFANPDSFAATPTKGVTIRVTLEPCAWNSGNWRAENEPDWQTDFDGGAGCATLYYHEDFLMDRDILLYLATPGELESAGALHYASDAASVADHVHAWWVPDLSAYDSVEGAPRSVVFVIDRSGSMSGDKIEETKKAVITCINQLAPEDYFGVLAFDTSVMKFSSEMTPGGQKSAAVDWVSGICAGGGTDICRGLVSGAAVGVTSPLEGATIDLLLITDANANVGITTPGGILDQLGAVADEYGRAIRVFGCGMGGDVVQTFVNDLAHATGAEATFALDDGEITGQITDLFYRIRGGGVSGISTEIQYPGRLEDDPFTWRRIFPGTIIRMGAKGSPPDAVDLCLTGSTPKMETVSLTEQVRPGAYGDAFDRIAAPLTAKAWADRLERRVDEGGETAELVDEAVVLARTYGTVTRYSSHLALETEEMYAEHGVERIERDAAGIAIGPVDGATADETRIGGQGTWDGASSYPTAGYVDTDGTTNQWEYTYAPAIDPYDPSLDPLVGMAEGAAYGCVPVGQTGAAGGSRPATGFVALAVALLGAFAVARRLRGAQ